MLQYFPAPEDPSMRKELVEVLKRILGGERGGIIAHSSAYFAFRQLHVHER